MPYRQLAQDILARWREAERLLETLPVESLEARRLQMEIAAMRDQYQRIVEKVREQGSNEPPFLPET